MDLLGYLKGIYTLLYKKLVLDEAISDGSTEMAYQEFTYTIPASDYVDVFVVFNYFRVLSLSANTLKIKVGDNGLESPFSGAGLGIDFENRFRRMRLINTGASSITVTCAFNNGHINDDRLNITSSIAVTGNVSIAGSTLTAGQVSVTNAAVQIKAANTARYGIIIKNPSTNTADVFIGIAGVTTATGIVLSVGESINIPNTAAVFGIHAAATETIHFLEY